MTYYPRDVCMLCKEAPPTLEALWALGKAHAWMCSDCLPAWKSQPAHAGTLVGTKVIAHGIARRRFDEDESPKAFCEGLYLKSPHGELIHSGTKTTIVKHRPFPELENGTFILVSGGDAYGVLSLGTGEELTPEEFDSRFHEHRVTTKERHKWWEGEETFWSYPIEAFRALKSLRKVLVPSGTQTFLDAVEWQDNLESPLWTTGNPPPCADGWTATEKRRGTKAANVEYLQSGDEEKAIQACIAAAGEGEKAVVPVEVESPPAEVEEAIDMREARVKAVRLDERVQKVRGAWYDAQEASLPTYNYVAEVWDDYVILEEGDTCYQIAYSWSEEDGATFAPRDEWTEVEYVWRAVKMFVGPDGGDWLLLWTMNSFEDLEEEIFTAKSIEEYVDRHATDETKGRFMFWHLPGTGFGDIKVQAISGRFLVEAGPFDKTEKGQNFARFLKTYPYGHPKFAPTGWGASHGYVYEREDRKDQVYDWFEKKESSVLPALAAANPYNPGMEVFAMNDKQRALLTEVGGEGLVQYVERTGLSLTEALEKAGVDAKEKTSPAGGEGTPVAPKPEVKEGAAEASAPAASESPTGGEAEDAVKELVAALAGELQLDSLSEHLQAQTTGLKALFSMVEEMGTRLEEAEKGTVERIAEKEAVLPRYFWFQNSDVAESALKAADPLRQAKPGDKGNQPSSRTLVAIAERLQHATS